MALASLPVVALAGTLNALMSFFIAMRLYFTYRERPQEAIRFFLTFYFLFGIFYLFFASAQLFFLDPRFGTEVGVLNVVSYFFLNMSLGYLLGFPYQVTGREKVARTIVLVVFAYNVIFTIVRLVYFSPSVYEQLNDYVYWRPVFPETLRLLTGLVSVGTAAFASTFFMRHGIRHKQDTTIRHRSFWLGSGIAMLLIAAALAFIVAPQGVASYILAATFLVLWGLILIMRGVLYAPPQQIDI